MKPIFFYIFLLFFFFQCKKHEENHQNTNWKKLSDQVSYKDTEKIFEFKSGKFSYEFSKNKLPFKRTIFLNASLLGFVNELSLEDKIVGVSSPEYIYSENLLEKIKSKKIAEVGNEQKYNLEKIIALKPDAIFTNYIANFENTYDLLKKNGIEIIFIDDFLVQNPIEKSSYLLLFGKLFNKEKEAEMQFKEITNNYQNLIKIAQNTNSKPSVLANEIYGNQWFLPGGKSQLAHFLKDANSNYIAANINDDKAIPLSFEEVFVKAENSKIWVNAGNHHSKKELLQVNPNYAKMNVFQNGRIYSIIGKEKNKANDFFESAVVRADLVLQDYIKILHPELLTNKELIYFKELK